MFEEQQIEEQQKKLVAGFVTGTWGTLGQIKVQSASGKYAHLVCLKEVTFLQNGKEKTFKVESCVASCSLLLMKLCKIDDMGSAASLKGACLVLPKEDCCHLEKNEWYIEDIVGCILLYASTEKEESQKVGQVIGAIEGANATLLEVRICETSSLLGNATKFDKMGKDRTVFVPFQDAFIGKVDIEKKQMQLLHLWILE